MKKKNFAVNDHEARRQGIGGSEAAASLGLDPYKTPVELYLEKTGLLPPEPQNEFMLWGTRLEPAIRTAGAKAVNKVFRRTGRTYFHRDHDWMFAHLDGIVQRERVIVECKNKGMTQKTLWGKPGTDQVPWETYIQCTHNMACARAESAYVVVLFGGNRLAVYQVPFHKELAKRMIEGEARFMERVRKKNPPDPVCSDDVALLNKFREPVGEIEADGDLIQTITEWREARETLTRQGALEFRIKQFMGAALALKVNGKAVFTWKPNKNGVRSFRATTALEELELNNA